MQSCRISPKLGRDVSDSARKRAGVSCSLDDSAERAGLLAASEAASFPGREHVRTVLVFASGRHAASTLEVAVGASEAVQGANVLVVGGVGLSSAEGEEPRSGALAIALDAPSAIATGEMPETVEDAQRIGGAMGRALHHARSRPMLCFMLPNGAVAQALGAFASRSKRTGGDGRGPVGERQPRHPHRRRGAARRRRDGGASHRRWIQDGRRRERRRPAAQRLHAHRGDGRRLRDPGSVARRLSMRSRRWPSESLWCSPC